MVINQKVVQERYAEHHLYLTLHLLRVLEPSCLCDLIVNFVVLRGLRDLHFCANLVEINAGSQRTLSLHNDHKDKCIVNFELKRPLPATG
jgi:hypothetical protein